jgi:hypothetical protein
MAAVGVGGAVGPPNSGGQVAEDIFGGPVGRAGGSWLRGRLKKPGAPGQSLDNAQAAFARELLTRSRAPRELYFQQMAEALRTGSATGKIPQTQYETEGARMGASAASQKTLDSLAAANLGGTPQGIAKLGGVRTAGDIAVGSTPSDVLMQYVLAAPGAVLGQTQQQIIQARGGLAAIEAQRYLAQQQATVDAYQGIGYGLGSLAGHFAPTPGGGSSGGSPSTSPYAQTPGAVPMI